MSGKRVQRNLFYFSTKIVYFWIVSCIILVHVQSEFQYSVHHLFAGMAVVLENHAAVYTDGRYFLQAENELDCNWILLKEGIP